MVPAYIGSNNRGCLIAFHMYIKRCRGAPTGGCLDLRCQWIIFVDLIVAVVILSIAHFVAIAGARCIAVKPISESTPADFENVADRLLIDSPCSGLGTLKRQPDLKWRLRPAAIERAHAIQKELLLEYPRMLKAGGRLVYATCSILPSQNRKAVDVLLEQGDFELLEERSISPAANGFDGFYAAALRKAGAALQ